MSTLMYQTAFGKAYYLIDEGKLHRKGSASVEVLENPRAYQVKMNYTIDKKRLVPVPDKYLAGQTTINLPSMFKDERGYLELESKKKMQVDGARLTHLGRTTFKKFNDAHKINIILSNGKGKIELVYHPSLSGAGWGNIKMVFISDIPLLNGYTIQCRLAEK